MAHPDIEREDTFEGAQEVSLGYLADKAELIIRGLPDEDRAIVQEHLRTEIEHAFQKGKDTRSGVPWNLGLLAAGVVFCVVFRVVYWGIPLRGELDSLQKRAQDCERHAEVYKGALEALLPQAPLPQAHGAEQEVP